MTWHTVVRALAAIVLLAALLLLDATREPDAQPCVDLLHVLLRRLFAL